MHSSDNKLLKLNPDTVMIIRKMYNLDKPGDMDKAIDVLEEWLKKQHHLTKKDYPRDFLERSIILMKGSVERAKSQIDNLCSMRTIFPKFYDKCDAKNDFNGMYSHWVSAFIPKLTEDDYRVSVTQFISNGITADILMDGFRFNILKCEYAKANDYCSGLIAILDYRNINAVELLAATDLIVLHQLIKIIIEGFGMRVKGIHLISPSKVAATFIKLLKPMLGPKVARRLYVHREIETLHDYVSRDVLPSELGGHEESLTVLTERWKNLLGTKENVDYMREMSKAVSNEAHRMREKLDSLDLGISGTFRSLNVD